MAAGTAPEPGTVSPPKIREVTGWLMRHPDALDTHDQQRLACLRTQCPTPGPPGRPRDQLRQDDHRADPEPRKLEAWLTPVEADDQPELHFFAAGIRRDQDTVTAGLTLPYSNR